MDIDEFLNYLFNATKENFKKTDTLKLGLNLEKIIYQMKKSYLKF
ncbi:hypothetical protein Mefer_0994 [Methanocaldococcus fervens AG86]|uniref:Uncharacterized protein n=1 Tax=Methanocaldococcus fervens (strain DSM 4213 / JCM 15782 / AG86) TaxID=573064 RepID=C7P8D0_METFA|nr:hypothetical protein Mefer_0994 [Methanocaldococcus fervens AG86]